jgi:hypothetical protein
MSNDANKEVQYALEHVVKDELRITFENTGKRHSSGTYSGYSAPSER